MKWAFWRGESGPGTLPGRGERAAGGSTDAGQNDAALALRIRARRRLIGAAALLLASVIVVPMVLDPAPRPVPDSVPIDLPSEKTPFTPRLPLPLPLVPNPGAVAEPAADAASADASGAKPADKGPDKPAEKSPEKAADRPTEKVGAKAAGKPDLDPSPEAKRALELLEGKATRAKAAEGRFFVQAAAPRSEQAAAELAARLKKAGLPSFTERVQASDGTRWRVRVGPYATRQDAERARARLRELGTGADLVVS